MNGLSLDQLSSVKQEMSDVHHTIPVQLETILIAPDYRRDNLIEQGISLTFYAYCGRLISRGCSPVKAF